MRHIGRHIWKTLLGVVCVGGLCAACTARQEICITGSVRNADGELLVCRHSVGGMFNSQTGDTLELQPDSTFTLTLPGGEYERVEFYLLRKKKMGSLLLKGGNVQVILDGRAEKPMIVEGLEEKTMRVAELLDSLYDDVFDIRVREGDRWGIARDTVAASVRRKLTDYALSLDKEVAGVDKELLDKARQDIRMQLLLAFQNQVLATARRVSEATKQEWLAELDSMTAFCSINHPCSPFSLSFYDAVSYDAGIRYYSGTARYHKTFGLTFPKEDSAAYFLQLEDVRDVGIARIRINGVDKGIVWTKPFRIEVTDELKEGTNDLEISVTNSWHNRVAGDELSASPKKYTHTNIVLGHDFVGRPLADGIVLEPSGLLGPVTIRRAVEVQ